MGSEVSRDLGEQFLEIPRLERLDLEVDAAVGIRLQRRQGAPGRRQQGEGLQQSQEHHEELQARQRLAQAHAPRLGSRPAPGSGLGVVK